jgi:DNA-binding Lrp family transcriptional regulator
MAGSDGSAVINLPLLKSGTNKITIIAYDFAKNTSTKTIEVNSPEPEAPRIQVSKTEVVVDESNSVVIKTYPDTDIVLYVQGENGAISTSSARTGQDGTLDIPIAKFDAPGVKKVWVSLNNDCANICVLSERVTVNVAERKLVQIPKALLKIVQNQSGTGLPWVIAGIFMALYFMTFRRKYTNKDLIQELNKAEIDVYKTFKVLKADAKKYKAMLKRNKVDLSEKDQVIMEDLEKDLDEAETYFAKRIEKIEREL